MGKQIGSSGSIKTRFNNGISMSCLYIKNVGITDSTRKECKITENSRKSSVISFNVKSEIFDNENRTSSGEEKLDKTLNKN